MLTVAWNYPYFLGIIKVLICFSTKAHRIALVVFVFMTFLFRDKPIDRQIREYANSKYGTSSHVDFIKEFKKFRYIFSVENINYEAIEAFRVHKQTTTTLYTSIGAMQALRSFIRFHKANTHLKANNIKDNGVILTDVGESARIKPMITEIQKVKLGRPRDMEYIKKVRVLKDQGGLTFRAIAVALKKDVKTVHTWYKFSFDDELVGK